MSYLMFAGEKVSPVSTIDDHWKEKWGHKFDARRALSTGHKQDPKFAPRGGVSSIELDYLPPLLPVPLWLCNNEIRDLIEKFEPNRHVFLPYKIHRKGAPSTTVNYNLVNFCDPIPALDIRSTDADVLSSANSISSNGYGVYTLNTLLILNRGKKIFLDQKRTMERHVWNDVYLQNSSKLFISDEFYDELFHLCDEKYLKFVKTSQGGFVTRLLNKLSIGH